MGRRHKHQVDESSFLRAVRTRDAAKVLQLFREMAATLPALEQLQADGLLEDKSGAAFREGFALFVELAEQATTEWGDSPELVALRTETAMVALQINRIFPAAA